MSENDHPTQCPYCRAAPPPEWFGGQEEWRCESCATRFVIRRRPWLEKGSEVKKDPEAERKDLIAKAYRGQLSVEDALRIVESLIWGARKVVCAGRPIKMLVPRAHPAVEHMSMLEMEITP